MTTNKQSNPIQEKANELIEENKPLMYLLDQFQLKLSQPPTNVAEHKYGFKYLPISHVRNLLNQTYYGLVQITDFEYRLILDQLTGTIKLRVFHPYMKMWLTYDGTASTQVRRRGKDDQYGKYKKGDLVPDGISMDLPRLKADAIKNAAKELGKLFGADLNRDTDKAAQYQAKYATYVKANAYSVEEVKAKLKTLKNNGEIVDYWETNKLWQTDGNVTILFDERKGEIKRGDFG